MFHRHVNLQVRQWFLTLTSHFAHKNVQYQDNTFISKSNV